MAGQRPQTVITLYPHGTYTRKKNTEYACIPLRMRYNVNMKQINNNWTVAALAVDVVVACVGFLCVLGCLIKIALYLAEIN